LQRITTSDAVSTLPAPVTPAASPGFFAQATNPLLQTTVSPDWVNSVQEELITVIGNAGIVPNVAVNTQLYQALVIMREGGQQYFSASGSFTVPASIFALDVEAWAGGGGGGGAASTTSSGGTGGSGGAYGRARIAVTPGEVLSFMVGAGGAGGAAGGGNGTAGGATTFNPFMGLEGGSGGAGDASNAGAGGGAATVVGATGMISFAGTEGGFSVGIATGVIGGQGGAAFQSPGAQLGVNGPGHSAIYPGAGGAGAAGADAAGGNGAPGMVTVRW
jgi:hypothetical protein